MENKKGQTSGLQTTILAIVGIAVILAVGLVVLGELKDTTAGAGTSVTYTNQTFTYTTNTSITFGLCVDSRNMGVTAVYNGTTSDSRLVDSGNYTITLNELLINTTETADVDDMESSINISYDCLPRTAAYNATQNNITEIAGIPTWIGILIVVMMAFIVLGYFYTKK